MGKGSTRRSCCTTSEEEKIRWQLKEGYISSAAFNRRYNLLKKKGLIRRSGIVIR